jgi:PAS domain S-box-containing protein
MSLGGRVAAHLDFIATDERRRLAAHGFAVGCVALSVLLRWMVSTSTDQPHFWLFHAAIALSALYGGIAPALVATLLSVLLERIGSAISLSTALLFGLEGLLIAFVVLHVTRAIARLTSSIHYLESAQRQARRVDCAMSRLEQASEDKAVILLDQTGHITDWQISATRLYGFESRQMVGRVAAAMFDEFGQPDLPRLLGEARQAATRFACRHVRGDGTRFAAEVEISPLTSGGSDGFAMIVHDLTHEQARAAADRSTATASAQLHAEVELAQRQLSTLQDLTDPRLNSLRDLQFVTELLDRLRTAITADGIALIHFGRDPHPLFCSSGGLQCQRGNHRPVVGVETDAAQTLVIHNDRSAIAEMSLAIWPDDVSSLIAVPLVRGGSTQAIMEVVNRTRRGATEWEIALVQVVAARVAGFLEDDSYTDSGAAAWTAPDSPSVAGTGSGADVRLTLGEHASEQG